MFALEKLLDDALSNHSVSNTHETSEVSTLDIVDGAVSLAAVFHALSIDVVHDGMEVLVDLFSSPVAVLGILADFKTGGSNTTSVDSLTRTEGDTGILDSLDSSGLRTHVGDLGNILHAVSDKLFCILFSELVLESAGASDVALDHPRLLTSGELALAGELVSHILNLVAVGSTHNQHIVDHFLGDTIGDLADAVRTGDSNNLSAEFDSLGSSTPSNVTEAGEGDSLTLHGVALFFDHVFHIVHGTETGSFGTDEGATPAIALTSESAGAVLASEFLVHTVHIANFAAANAYVTSGAVLIGTDIAPEFIDKSLAEAHDFGIALSNGVEISTTLTTAERQHGQAVLEDLLEAQELQHGDVNGLVETETTFVGAEGGVVLDTVAEVRLDFAIAVNPSHAEREDTIRLDESFDDLGLFELRVLVVDFFDAFEHFAHCLQILIFARMLGFQSGHNFIDFHFLTLIKGLFNVFERLLHSLKRCKGRTFI